MNIKLKIKEAAEFLGRRGRRIELIFFGLILVFVSLTPLFLYSYIEYLFAALTEYIVKSAHLTVAQGDSLFLVFSVATLCIVILFAIFVTLPVFSCFFGHSYRLYREGIAGRSQYLSFGKRGYFGAIGSGAVICGVLALCLAPVVALATLGNRLALSENERIVIIVKYLFVIAIAVGLVLGFLIFMLFRPLFLFGYYTARGEKVLSAISKSVARMRSPRAKQIYKEYIKAFLPSLLLSVASVLVLFLIDTLPKMSLVYFEAADEIVYGEQQ